LAVATPAEIRQTFATTGSLQTNPGSGNIGPLPDVLAAMEAMGLLTCGQPILTGLAISGPSLVDEASSSDYDAMASWDDGTTSSVAASWSENSAFASIDGSGVLTTSTVISNQSVTVGASYTSDGVTKTAAKTVTIVDSVKILTGLTISGPSSVNEVSSADYDTIASWDDGTTSYVIVNWSENSPFASINSGGLLATSTVTSEQSVTISVSYSSGGVTKTAAKTVTIVDSVKILTGLAISGLSSVNETNSASYSATASWDDGTTSTVAASWSENSAFASIDGSGELTTSTVTSEQSVTISVNYSSGGVTKTAAKTVTIVDSVMILTGLTIGGPSSVIEVSSAGYSAAAS
jgi:hypothetical protein